MPTLPFVTLDVFTLTRYSGNPLAIVLLPPASSSPATPDSDPLSTTQMQQIAAEFNLSETVFLHAGAPSSAPTPSSDPSSAATSPSMEWRVRIFTVSAELPFAGHPTIGAASYALTQQQQHISAGRLVCNAGPIDIALAPDGVLASAAIPHNVHVHVEKPYSVAEVLALQPGLEGVGLLQDAVRVVSPVKGMNFVTVELPDLAALARVRTGALSPTPRLDEGWEGGFVGGYYYVVTSEGRVRSRMVEGTMEDAATGSAACALSAYLALKGAQSRGRRQRFSITQGVEMGRESLIGVEVGLGEGLDVVERVVLSGTAVKVMEGTIEY